MARGEDITAQMESWTTASVECVETCAFFRGQKQSKIAPKWGFEPIFPPHDAARSILTADVHGREYVSAQSSHARDNPVHIFPLVVRDLI